MVLSNDDRNSDGVRIVVGVEVYCYAHVYLLHLYSGFMGQKALLVGGRTDPVNDKVSVWAFDTETECWSLWKQKEKFRLLEVVTLLRANSVLILFGGETAKKKKLNDLHMFDLKSATWLTLQCTLSPRSNHVATLYDDKTLLVFGGASKSRTLNDLYSLDFETMVWSRIKIRGFHPSPRAGCCGVLCGTKWYIAGGGSRKKRHTETFIYDVLKSEWSVAVASPPSSITTNKGFSLVLVQHKDKDFLVAFGGYRKEPSNQYSSRKNESSMGRQSNLGKCAGKRSSSVESASQPTNGSANRSVDWAARQNLAAVIEHGSGRRSMSDLSLVDQNPLSGNATERKPNQSDAGVPINAPGTKFCSDESFLYECESSNPQAEGITNITVGNDNFVFPDVEGKSGALSAPSSIYQFYETRMAALSRKNGILEVQLAAALASRDSVERNLGSALKSKEEMEKRLADTVKEMDLLKEKLSSIELAQDANNLSNIHSDNVRLEHDELHSTRGVLAGERARAFQLQVEVFHLKQRQQSMENRAPTSRKPFNV
ncbi:anaphase-promoting complex subunit 7-like [Hibiscus syriacus]|uniref:Anaphase-promoting complex subunit 7-like n=1 Tax=Hibiscus syriacus TaxID=106335 RepID=A0A6A2XLZ3_HIBSY|nr:anaphase-promoting complex subunit 7-like [Hibiscus syriacus]